MKKLFYILTLLILASCSTIKKQTTSTEVLQKKDSDSVKIVVQTVKERYDSIIYIPAATTDISLGNPCDSFMKLKHVDITINKGGSQTKVWTKNDQIFISDSCGPAIQRLQKIISEKDSANSQLKARYVTDSKATADKEVKMRIPFWCWLIMILEGLLIVLMSYVLIRTILKI